MPAKTIVVRLALLFLPLALWQAVELFVLPIDYFTFRFWEALATNKVYLLPGPFYPNFYLEKYSAGDHVFRGPRKKLVRFQSDEYGQRNPPDTKETYEIVIVGDSNIVGSHIDEPDTIRARLESRCNCRVYAYGSGLPGNILSFLADERFVKHPPPYVVFEFRTGDVEQGDLPVYRPCGASAFPNRTLAARLCDSVDTKLLHVLTALGLQQHEAILIYLDRLYKQPAYHFLHSQLRLTATIHLAGPAFPFEPARIERSMEALRSYRAALHERGSKLILFAMPKYIDNKRSFSPWLSQAREESFDVISIDPSSVPPEILSSWWMKEDSHWREQSIEFAAGLIWKEISALAEKPGQLPTAMQ